MNDTCARFSNLSSCKKNEVQQTAYPQATAPESRDTYTNLGNNNHNQEFNDYCIKYSPKYTSYCHGNKLDNVILQFCGYYLYKCAIPVQFGPHVPVTKIPSSEDQGSAALYLQSLSLCSGDITHYCNVYSRYYKHCLGSRIQSDAIEFCSAYKNLCTTPTNDMDDLNYRSQILAHVSGSVPVNYYMY